MEGLLWNSFGEKKDSEYLLSVSCSILGSAFTGCFRYLSLLDQLPICTCATVTLTKIVNQMNNDDGLIHVNMFK